ncbi:MAG: DUF1566 domain-containing protein [Methylococcales bacterium]|nr:DUF1566 domain-containing protein [Methylococcales bacterium]
MLKLKKSGVILSIILAGVSNHSIAQTCLALDQYPDEWTGYTVHNNGTVTDGTTGLMWKVCSEGLSSSDLASASCNTGGSGATFTWTTALQQAATVNSTGFAGHSDWRLPNVEELNTLSANNCHAPAINETIFPVTSSLRYWTSSPYAGANTEAWTVNFNLGEAGTIARTSTYPVRLVRTP